MPQDQVSLGRYLDRGLLPARRTASIYEDLLCACTDQGMAVAQTLDVCASCWGWWGAVVRFPWAGAPQPPETEDGTPWALSGQCRPEGQAAR